MGFDCSMDRVFIIVLCCCGCFLATGTMAMWDTMELGDDQCDIAVREIVNEDRATVVDDSPSRLHAVWISQECEIRAGPEFVIRKYTFFENGTFLLMRHYYAEESCSIATHTITARGVIKILDNSLVTPGATEARYHLDTVHVSPLNRQVAHKLGHRVNVSCGPQQRWRPYQAQLIYERAPERYAPLSTWQGPRYNSLQGHQSVTVAGGALKIKTVNCLAPLGIDFDELRLLRVQRRPTGFRSASFGARDRPRVELFLGSLPPDQASKRTHRPTSLQPTSLLRTDTIHNCPICGSISRGTENSPPLLHEVVALPALLGGSWISPSCESHPGGVWLRRQLRVYGGDKLWTGRWDYFSDPRCSNFLYSITAAGSYVQRARRHRRHDAGFQDDDDLIEQDVMHRVRRQAGEDKPTKKMLLKKLLRKNVRGSEQDITEEMSPQLSENTFDIDMYAPPRLNLQPMMPTYDEITANIGDTDESKIKHLSSSEQGQLEAFDSNDNEEKRTVESRPRRSVDDVDYYRQLLQSAQPSMAESFAAMLRGNQRREETTKKPLVSITPTGTTELDLHVAESLLIAGDPALAKRCGAALTANGHNHKASRLSSWPSNCVPHSLDAPSTLGLRARISVDWYGQYTLMLGARDKNLWDAPLMQCGPTSMKNPLLRSHLRRSVGLRFGILFNASSRSLAGLGLSALIVCQLFVVWFTGYVTR